MRILMVFPGLIHQLPPLQSALLEATEQGASVEALVRHVAPDVREWWAQKGVKIHTTGPMHERLWKIAFLRKLAGLVSARPDVTWWHGVHAMRTALLLQRASLGIIVAHAHEYYQEALHRWVQDRFVRKAHVVVAPEATRLGLLRAQSQTLARGFVVPNRPHQSLLPPRGSRQSARSSVQALFRAHPDGGAQQVLLYQGLIAQERCLVQVLQGFSQVKEKGVGLMVMGSGSDGSYLERVSAAARRDKRVIMAPSIPAPGHLEVTSGCDIGVMLYSQDSVNNFLCAPNKLYEYTQFGLGIAMPEVPHLASLPHAAEFGAFCNPGDADSIAMAMRSLLERDASRIRAGAAKFLETQLSTSEAFAPVMKHLRVWAKA